MERNRHLFWKNPSPRLSLFVLALCLFISPSMMANGNPNFTLEELDCDNVTEGGAIVGNQTLCLPYNTQAATITNAAFPTGGEGAIEYLWLQSSIPDYFPGSPDWSFVPNQPIGGSPDLTPGYLTTTTYYIRCARRDGCDLYVGESNIIEIKVANAPVISGADATDLTCAGLPTGSIDLHYTGGTGALTFTWSLGSPNGTIVSSNADPSGLLAGSYYVNIEDNCGCSASYGPVSVGQPAGIVIDEVIDDLDCFGDEDASITANVSGSTGPYTYEWNSFYWEFPFTLGNTISDLAPGTYTLTVTDANGCTATETYVINDPSQIIISTEGTDITCNGASDGTTIVYVSGLIPPYTYLWSTGNPNNNMTGRPAGTYTVTVTDGNGCSEVGSYTVNEPDPITASPVTEDAVCFGEEGNVDFNISGGTAPYTIGGEGLTAGTYVAVITDANGCSTEATYTINQPDELVVTTSDEAVLCNGDTDATVTVNTSGGSPGYNWLWSTGQTGVSSVSGLGAGTYSITVLDTHGCSEVVTSTVTEPDVLAVEISSTDVVCNGEDNGTASAGITGGTEPYTISWSNGSDAADLSDLAPGDYTVDIVDANGCTTNGAVTITEPAVLETEATSTNITCNGDNDGTAGVTATGGTEPYSYAWSDGSTIPDLSGLAPGDYSVVVTDANGCTSEQAVTVTEPDALFVDMINFDVSCNGVADGAATAAVGGGTFPYTFTWSNGNTNDGIGGLSGGTYTVAIVDANGCTVDGEVVIFEPEALTLDVSSTDIACAGDNNGTASATIAGGTEPYTITWSNGASEADLSDLGPGDYNVAVVDANGCEISGSVTITQPDALNVSVSSTNISCNGANDGTASVAVSGGTEPYTIAWSDGSSATDLSGLAGGEYSVLVTDANGCTSEQIVTIFEPGALTVDVDGGNIACAGDANGYATANVSGGTAPYTFTWSNGNTNNGLGGLTAGEYSVIVEDANGCTASGSITISEPSSLSISTSGTNVSCNGANDGSASASVSGGTAPYTISWSNGGNTADLSDLGPGDYTVNVVDANGCSISGSYTVTQPDAISISLSSSDITCNGDNNGTASVSVSGGTGSLSIAWSNGSSEANLSGLSAGAYSVTVTDASGCSATAETFIAENPAVGITASSTDVTCAGYFNGTATAAPTGGTGTYTVTWSNGQTGNSISGLGGGEYTATVVDGNGCTASATVTVVEPEDLNVSVDGTGSDCSGGGSAGASATGGTGAYTFNWNNGMTGNVVTGLQGGSYTVTVTDANGCTATGSIEISTPNTLGLFLDNSSPSCNGGSDGSATVTATFGGTAPYSYAWSNGGTGETINNLTSGSYEVVVTDANGCTVSQSTFIGEPSAVGVSAWASEVGCEGGGMGEATAVAFGGSGVYTYAWSNGATGTVASGLAAGNYEVTATDENGCTGTASIYVPENMGITVSAEGFDANCGETGYAVANATGGTGVYTFSWSNGVDGQTNGGLTPGTYTVNVTSGGCTASATVTINGSEGISATATGSTADCSNNGTANASGSGGSGSYTYAWSNGQTDASLSGLAAGTYTVVVTDAVSGCTATATATVGGTVDPGCDDGDCTNGVEYWDGCNCVAGEAPVDPGCDDGNCANGVEFWDGCGCVAGEAPVDPGCDDGDCTNGIEFWDGCGCVEGTPPVDPGCDDGDCSNGLETWDGCDCVAGTPNVDPGCDDGDCSNGVETWDGCNCVAGTPPVDPGCDDGDCSNGVETWDGCECVAGTPPEVTSCDDGDACNGIETYDEATCQCVSGPAPDLGTPFITTTDNTTLCLNSDQTSINVDVANLGDATNSDWLITDENSIILATGASNPVDFSGAGSGVCVVWYIAYEGELGGYEVGADAFAITGCYKLSNSISVTRQDPAGGTLSTDDPLEICAGDGIGDPIDVTLEGATGENNAWVITDEAGNILGLPAAPPFDLDGAGAGVCLIWNVSFDGELTGATVGANAADLGGCYELSNPIAVVRNQPAGGNLTTSDPTTICAGDGVADPIDVTLDGNVGADGTWVITDEAGNILGLPAAPPFDLEGAGAGTCLIWHLSSYGEVGGAELGANANGLTGCYELSNPIAVVRQTPQPSVISTTDPTTVCSADGIADEVNVDMVPGVGDNHAWVITDAAGNILALPAAPPFNFEGAGAGVCLIWCVDYYGELGGAEVGANAADLTGCYALSEPIEITRSDATSIGNYVWHDANQNGCQDLGELGIGQVLAQLVTAGADGVFCTGDDVVVDSEYTAFNGSYTFSCVEPGEYVVNFTNFPGPWQVTGQNACDDENDSDVDPLTGCSDPITVVGSGNDFSIDLGLFGSCLNHTDGGVIGSTQDVCAGFDVEPFESIEDASGGTGITEYLWMYTTTPGPFSADTWNPISASDVAAYASGPLTQTTYFIRCSRIQGCDTYVESNIITVSVINNPTFCFEGFIGIDADVITADEIQVRWSTNPEREDYQYHVEVSENGTVFETIGSMAGYGIANAVNSYEFMHDNNKIGTIFYRVRRVANGVTDFSETVSVNIDAAIFGEVAVYPNPIKDVVNIKFMEPLLKETTAQLITPLGQVVTTVVIPAGTITHNMDVSRYSVGTYFLKITNDELGTQGFKLVKPAQ